MSKIACALAHTLLKIKLFIEPPCKAEKEGDEDKNCKGGAVLVEGRDITDWDGFGFRHGLCEGVRLDCLAVTPTRVPPLQIHSIGGRAYPHPLPEGKGDFCGTVGQRHAVMEIDAVADGIGGEMLTVVSRGQTVRR